MIRQYKNLLKIIGVVLGTGLEAKLTISQEQKDMLEKQQDMIINDRIAITATEKFLSHAFNPNKHYETIEIIEAINQLKNFYNPDIPEISELVFNKLEYLYSAAISMKFSNESLKSLTELYYESELTDKHAEAFLSSVIKEGLLHRNDDKGSRFTRSGFYVNSIHALNKIYTLNLNPGHSKQIFAALIESLNCYSSYYHTSSKSDYWHNNRRRVEVEVAAAVAKFLIADYSDLSDDKRAAIPWIRLLQLSCDPILDLDDQVMISDFLARRVYKQKTIDEGEVAITLLHLASFAEHFEGYEHGGCVVPYDKGYAYDHVIPNRLVPLEELRDAAAEIIGQLTPEQASIVLIRMLEKHDYNFDRDILVKDMISEFMVHLYKHCYKNNESMTNILKEMPKLLDDSDIRRQERTEGLLYKYIFPTLSPKEQSIFSKEKRTDQTLEIPNPKPSMLVSYEEKKTQSGRKDDNTQDNSEVKPLKNTQKFS